MTSSQSKCDKLNIHGKAAPNRAAFFKSKIENMNQSLFTPIKKTCYACANNLVGKEKTCYACKNDLVGMPKGKYEEWECMCEEWECTCVNTNYFHCPICDKDKYESSYLAEAIKDEKARWIANMITHYRHDHITSWNKMWGENGWRYQQAAHYDPLDYEQRKIEVNERAKRQIIRKSFDYLKANGITKEHFLMLQNNDDIKTLELLNKKFQ